MTRHCYRLVVLILHRCFDFACPGSEPEQAIVGHYNELFGKNGTWIEFSQYEHWPRWLR